MLRLALLSFENFWLEVRSAGDAERRGLGGAGAGLRSAIEWIVAAARARCLRRRLRLERSWLGFGSPLLGRLLTAG